MLRQRLGRAVEQFVERARAEMVLEPLNPDEFRRPRPQRPRPAEVDLLPTDETAPRPRRPVPAPVRPGPTPRDQLIAALSSRSGLRQAFLMKEILGPPKALDDPRRQGPEDSR